MWWWGGLYGAVRWQASAPRSPPRAAASARHGPVPAHHGQVTEGAEADAVAARREHRCEFLNVESVSVITRAGTQQLSARTNRRALGPAPPGESQSRIRAPAEVSRRMCCAPARQAHAFAQRGWRNHSSPERHPLKAPRVEATAVLLQRRGSLRSAPVSLGPFLASNAAWGPEHALRRGANMSSGRNRP